jgi:HPt (histidine-containing phosphotransfer) domain-containing protein
VSDDVQAAVARLWQRSRPIVLQRVGALQDTATALAAGRLDAEAVGAARSEAHKLVGSLGTFGVPRGSELARCVEHELEAGGRDAARLADLTAQLRAVVEAA